MLIPELIPILESILALLQEQISIPRSIPIPEPILILEPISIPQSMPNLIPESVPKSAPESKSARVGPIPSSHHYTNLILNRFV